MPPSRASGSTGCTIGGTSRSHPFQSGANRNEREGEGGHSIRQRVGPRDDGGSGARARLLRHRARDGNGVGAPEPRPGPRIRQGGARAGRSGVHRGRGDGEPSRGRRRGAHDASGDRRPARWIAAPRGGRALFDRADAARRSGRDRGDRRRGCEERGGLGGADPRALGQRARAPAGRPEGEARAGRAALGTSPVPPPPRIQYRDAARGETVARVAAALKEGAVAFLPAEGVYGYHAIPTHEAAVARLAALKARNPSQGGKGWIALVGRSEDANRWVRSVPAPAAAIIRTHWPGGVTLILEAGPSLPEALRAAGGTV